MAGKLTVAVLFFLFAIACARTPVDLTESDLAVQEASEILESDPKVTAPSILLPSQKHDSELATVEEFDRKVKSGVPEIEPYSASEALESELAEPIKGTKESETVSEVPLTFVSFHPINRHFPRRPLLPFRFGHRCRHHQHRQMKPWSTRFNSREIPYGKDMILSRGEQDLGLDLVPRVDDRQIRSRWENIRQAAGDRFPFVHELERQEEMKFPIRHHDEHHHHHHHHHRHHYHMEGEEEDKVEREQHGHDEEHENGGFMRKIRKFLNRF